ncbi:MAG: D-alanyl-D-alanine carboxypeptidase [Oscillospiraceae bacterium]|nr:D-alanyl-D-alanine carboxypeptidase [Oscillospiraceae bacterium]
MKVLRSALALLLCVLLLCGTAGAALAEGTRPYLIDARVGELTVSLRAYSDSYEGNLFLSLSDLAQALRGTEKQFRVDYQSGGSDGELWRITTGEPAPKDEAKKDTTNFAISYLSLKRNRLFVDDGERRYYSYRSDDRELYLSLADVQLLLDLTIRFDGAGQLRIDPTQPFAPDLYELKQEDYFGAFNAVLVGDADTGEVLFSHNRAWRYPIASLSKLMTYLLLAEAIEDGEIDAQAEVTISTKAARLSWSADGVVSLSPGDRIPLEELMQAMMLASSNECALALAEYAEGSEEDFVARMNERAAELGLLSARFYTPHGLPSYSESSLPGKRQNSMSAMDLFRLSAYLLEKAPEVTEMTGLQFVHLSKLGFTTANSNPLVFNMPGVNGLKTGSTNRAGYCVVASLPVTVNGETHTIVAVVLGAETAELRGQAGEILLRYARAYYEENGFGPKG